MNLVEIGHWGKQMFESSICCMIRQVDLLDIEEIRHRGQFSTGDEEWDDGWKNSWTQCHRPISDIAQFYLKGTPVRIKNAQDLPYMYEVVHSFLLAWKNYLSYTRVVNAPIEQLLGLTEFCKAVHHWASGVACSQPVQMGGYAFFEFSRASFTAPEFGAGVAQEIAQGEAARLQSMKEAFVRAVSGLS